MNRNFIDLTHQKFGRLLVIERGPDYINNSKKYVQWNCLCDCGKFVTVARSSLRKGESLSCGCYRKDLSTVHGMKGSPTYITWQSMIDRCFNRNNSVWEFYGGDGVTVCDRWLSFENFYEDMGDRPAGNSIHRINNEKVYNKENCIWASMSIQNYDKRVRIDCLSKVTGVHWHKRDQIWVAQISLDKKRFQVYSGPSFEEAVKARKAAEIEHYGYNK